MTSIEHLLKKFPLGLTWTMAEEIREAKEIHKQECIKFYVKGCEDTYGMDEGTDDEKDAEKYYNETFKK